MITYARPTYLVLIHKSSYDTPYVADDGFIDENEFYAAPLKLDGKLPKKDAPDGLALLKDDVASLRADTDRQNDETGDLPTEGTGNEKEENGNANSTASDWIFFKPCVLDTEWFTKSWPYVDIVGLLLNVLFVLHIISPCVICTIF